MKSYLPRLPRALQYKFDRQRNPDNKMVNEDHTSYDSPEQVSLNNEDEPKIELQTNVMVHKIDPIIEVRKAVETKNPPEKTEPTPEVSNGGLQIPPKRPDEISTQIDMSKDEWLLGEIIDLHVTAIPFFVDKLIPLNTLNVLAGQSERGKSTFYTQLSLAIIRGDEEFLGYKLNTTCKRVLVISTEDGPVPLSFRINKQLSQTLTDVEFRDRLTFITNADDIETRIEKHLMKNRVDLLVIDAFGDVFNGGDINASHSVRRFLERYNRFISQYGCTVLFVHHVGKAKQGNRAEKDLLLGSTGIEGKMRNVLMLSIVNDQHQLSIAKGNYVKWEDKKIPLYLDFDTNTLTFSRADGPAKPPEGAESRSSDTGSSSVKSKPGRQKDMEKYNQAIQLYNEGKSQVEIAGIVGRDKSTVCKWIKEYKANQAPPPEPSAV